MAYLDDHPPARRQFYCPRRDGTEASGTVVVHTAENTPDYVAVDGGAEAVASFIVGRDDPGSYHVLADSDSWIRLVRYECEAFHDATGTNRWSFGVSAATRADVWPMAPAEWRDGCVRNMAAATADFAHWLKARRGIVIPARRITVAQARARVAGFISHAELDPERRHDPGDGFPWAQFLEEFARAAQPQEDDDMAWFRRVTAPGKTARLVTGEGAVTGGTLTSMTAALKKAGYKEETTLAFTTAKDFDDYFTHLLAPKAP